MDADYLQGTTSAKLKVVGLLIAFFALYGIYRYVLLVDLPDISLSSTTEHDMQEYLNRVSSAGLYLNSLLMAVFIYIASICYTFAKRIHIHSQFPPPGAEMPFTVKILRGKKALNQSRAYYACAVMSVAYGLLKLGMAIYTASALRKISNAF